MRALTSLAYEDLDSEWLFIELVRRLPRNQSIRLFANLSAIAWNAWESDQPNAILEAQVEASKAFAHAPLLEEVVRGLDSGQVFLHPEQAALAVKVVLTYAQGEDAPLQGPENVAFAANALETLLRLNGLMRASEDEMVAANDGGRSWSLRAGAFQISERYGNILGRYANFFVWASTDEARSSSEYLDINADLPRLLNFEVGEYFTGLMAIYGQVGLLKGLSDVQKHSAVFDPAVFLLGTEHPERIVQIIEQNAIDEDELVASFNPSDPNRWSAISLMALWSKPFVRLHDGNICIPSPKYIQNASGTAIFHRLAEAYARDGGDKQRGRFTSFFGNYLEAYVAQLMCEGTTTGSRSVVRETEYIVAKMPRKSTDVVAIEGRAAVLLEVVAKRLNAVRSIRDLDAGAIRKDLNQMVVDKAAEISRRIDDFRNDCYAFDGVTAKDLDDIYPVVVIVEPLLTQFGMAGTFETDLSSRAALQDTNGLQIIDIESLEAVQYELQRGTLLSVILAAKLSNPNSSSERLKDFLLANGYDVQPTAQCNERLRRVQQWVFAYSREWGIPGAESVDPADFG